MASNLACLICLPPEIRHAIVAFAIWTPGPPPDANTISQDRVRLRKDWDIWVSASLPQPAALPLLLTCRLLRNDVAYLMASSHDRAHELDIVFIPDCGLFPTWTCCPLLGQGTLVTISASFRMMHVDDIDDTTGGGGPFATYFRGLQDAFSTADCYPNPSPGSWNFYRLIASLLALGPKALASPQYQSKHFGFLSTCRFAMKELIISVTTNEETDQLYNRRRGPARFLLGASSRQDGLFYGRDGGEQAIFPGPSRQSQYGWTGNTTIHDFDNSVFGDGDGLGLYLANTTWSLLDFEWLSRGFGLMVYEGVLDAIAFYVDGEPRARYEMEQLLARPPGTDCTPEVMEALICWKEWVTRWRSKLRQGALLAEPRPVFPFLRYKPHRRQIDEWMDAQSDSDT